MLLDWDRAIVFIFFFYGLAFYSLGLALLIESGRASELSLARSMRLLAGFGLLHGTHEWIDMFERELDLHYQQDLPAWLLWIRLALLVTSFIALFAYGEHLLRSDKRAFAWHMTGGAVTVFMIMSVIVSVAYDLDDRGWARAIDVLSRYFLGLPSALLSAWALWQQRTDFRSCGMERFTRGLSLAALALILYGAVGQIFVAESVFFPSTVIHAELFQQVTGFPIQLFRALVAGIVTMSMLGVLRSLEFESQQRLESIKRSKLEAERHSREELARLNVQLQAAHEETTHLLQEVQRRDTLRGELLRQITTAQESERKRIARELHDGTGQMLTGLALALRGTAHMVETDPATAAQRLSELESMATNSIGELRHLINDLRPPQLDDMGLAAALRWQIKNLNSRSDVDIRLEIHGEPRTLSPEVETTLFRIAQESLTNIFKHAQAKQAGVILDFKNGLTLKVWDNGVGFDTSAVLEGNRPRTAWGLLGIYERANLIGATLSLESALDQGTTLTISLQGPFQQEVGHDDSGTHN